MLRPFPARLAAVFLWHAGLAAHCKVYLPVPNQAENTCYLRLDKGRTVTGDRSFCRSRIERTIRRAFVQWFERVAIEFVGARSGFDGKPSGQRKRHDSRAFVTTPSHRFLAVSGERGSRGAA